jgi:hypothetical protein
MSAVSHDGSNLPLSASKNLEQDAQMGNLENIGLIR